MWPKPRNRIGPTAPPRNRFNHLRVVARQVRGDIINICVLLLMLLGIA
jgi:hypothetical protein